MNTWLFGMSGTGKTTELVRRALKDIDAGNGVLFVDPDGSAIDAILSRFPKRRRALIIDPTDIDYPVGFNPLSDIENKPLVVSLLKDTVKALWRYDRVPTPVMDRVLYNTLSALLEYPEATLLHVEPMLTDSRFRQRVLERVSDPVLLRKWAYWTTKKKKDWDQLIGSTENKAGEFSEDPRIRNIIGQPSTFNLRRMISGMNVILLRLPHGQLGNKAAMFGSLFLAHLLATAQIRKTVLPFHVYIDDCHHFDTPVLAQLLSSASRLGLSITVANQYLSQLSPDLRSALIANSGTRLMLRCGIEDSEFLHRTIPHNNTMPMLHDLSDFDAIRFDGSLVHEVLSAISTNGRTARRIKVVEQSRRRYGRKRGNVEEFINRSLGG